MMMLKLRLMMMLKLMLGYLAKVWVKQERVVWRLRSISWLAVLFVLSVALAILFGSWLFLQPLLSYHWQTTYRKKKVLQYGPS